MKYILLMYAENGAWPPEDHRVALQESIEMCHKLNSKQQYLGASPLQPASTAVCVRVRDGNRIVSDGPYAETKEQLGGYFLIDVEDLDEAIAIAAQIPGARRGTAEIRPIMEGTRGMKLTKTQVAGWVLSGLVGAFLVFGSAAGKFVDWEGKEEMFQNLGYTVELMTKIGILEVLVTVLFLIPRTSLLGAVLLTGYLGGATATHVRVGDSFLFPVLIGVVIWIALGLRRPEVFSLATGVPPQAIRDTV
jgi:uncharacterized membrane protein YphA (DoxX/SURF4 family)